MSKPWSMGISGKRLLGFEAWGNFWLSLKLWNSAHSSPLISFLTAIMLYKWSGWCLWPALDLPLLPATTNQSPKNHAGQQTNPWFIKHVHSYTGLPGNIAEENAQVDKLITSVELATIKETRRLYHRFHLSPSSLCTLFPQTVLGTV